METYKQHVKKGSSHGKCIFEGDLYHAEVYLPDELKTKALDMFQDFQDKPRIPGHINENRGCDECHDYSVTSLVRAIRNASQTDVYLFEVGTEPAISAGTINTSILKFAVRLPYDEERDAVVVFSSQGRIKTAWLNRRLDTHRTLDTSKYVQRPKN